VGPDSTRSFGRSPEHGNYEILASNECTSGIRKRWLRDRPQKQTYERRILHTRSLGISDTDQTPQPAQTPTKLFTIGNCRFIVLVYWWKLAWGLWRMFCFSFPKLVTIVTFVTLT